MPRTQSILIALLCAVSAAGQDAWLLFTGDVLLSRQVRVEIERSRIFPWSGMQPLFQSADWLMGNLEGAVGLPTDCLPADTASPCFDVRPDLVTLLSKAGFRAMGVANNHSNDLGPKGVNATGEALNGAGLEAVSFEKSPVFFNVNGHRIAVIAVSTVPGRDGSKEEIPSIAIRQKLRLASGLAELVVVSVHWGSELLEWPQNKQREMAAWLVENGADLIVGHHPHVVQAPQCVQGRPVFYSLGNHLFDQKYPESKRGLIADCRMHAGQLRCGGITTETPMGSSYPALGEAISELESCPVTLKSMAVSGFTLRGSSADEGYRIEGWDGAKRVWRSIEMSLLSVEYGMFAGKQMVFTLERHLSPIDGEDGVRPYVYEVGPRGLVAKWRGSALAWPLLDAKLLPGSDGVLCGLHRRDSFVSLQPGSKGTRIAAYRWNGFGFSGVDEVAGSACATLNWKEN